MFDTTKNAAYCDDCSTIYVYEPRDVFSGEVFCPNCSARTNKDNHSSLDVLSAVHPEAQVYSA